MFTAYLYDYSANMVRAYDALKFEDCTTWFEGIEEKPAHYSFSIYESLPKHNGRSITKYSIEVKDGETLHEHKDN